MKKNSPYFKRPYFLALLKKSLNALEALLSAAFLVVCAILLFLFSPLLIIAYILLTAFSKRLLDGFLHNYQKAVEINRELAGENRYSKSLQPAPVDFWSYDLERAN